MASLVCSCLGILPLAGPVMAIAGITLGVSARRQIRKSQGWLVGDGIARAGIIVGTTLLVVGVVVTAILLATHHSGCDGRFSCSSSPHRSPTTTRVGGVNPSKTSPSASRSPVASPGSTGPVVVSPTTTTPKTAATAPVVTLSISGTGTASSIAVLDGSGETEHTDVQLPYSTNVRLAGHFLVAIDAQAGSGDPSTSISCAIDVAGRTLVSHTSTGPYPVVSCNAAPRS